MVSPPPHPTLKEFVNELYTCMQVLAGNLPSVRQMEDEWVEGLAKIRATRQIRDLDTLKERFEEKKGNAEFDIKRYGDADRRRLRVIRFDLLSRQTDEKITYLIYQSQIKLVRSYVMQREATKDPEDSLGFQHLSRVIKHMAKISEVPDFIARDVFDALDVLSIDGVETELDNLETLEEIYCENAEQLAGGSGRLFVDEEEHWWGKDDRDRVQGLYMNWINDLGELRAQYPIRDQDYSSMSSEYIESYLRSGESFLESYKRKRLEEERVGETSRANEILSEVIVWNEE